MSCLLSYGQSLLPFNRNPRWKSLLGCKTIKWCDAIKIPNKEHADKYFRSIHYKDVSFATHKRKVNIFTD